jgi:redox-sensitive bicupin YhaK (pirin superfamily)
MWLAQPEGSRHGVPAFQHLDELPETALTGARARVLIGRLDGAVSPAEFGHPSIGLDLELSRPAVIPTEPGFEHAVVPIDRTVRVDEDIVPPGSLAIVPTGRSELRLDSPGYPARLMLLGGEPLGETVKMWWNFVARTTEELTEAWHDWNVGNEDRFGPVATPLARIEAPTPPWIGPD